MGTIYILQGKNKAGDKRAARSGSEATLKPTTKSVDEVFGKLHSPSRPPRTVEQMNEAVAGRIRSRRR